MRASDLSDLLSLRREYGAGLSVEFVDFPHVEWEQRDGRIAHRRTDFFSVVGQRDESGVEHVLFRQPETALVGLLTAAVSGERYLLLSARAEPGLHGGCQFSTTVQSTPSNYERRHGGAATPLIETFLDPSSRARVVHDSMQYDWGQYYDAKVKRFLILEVAELFPVEPPLVWVAEATFEHLLGEDFAVTCDLRAAAVALYPPGGDTTAAPSAPPPQNAAPVDVPLAEMRNWRNHPNGIDEIDPVQRVAIRYVATRASSREVAEWSQPLMVVEEPLDICLPVRETAEGTELAVHVRTATGLRGALLWYPAALVASAKAKTARAVRSSAEGGRFMRHEIRISTVAAVDDDVVAGSRWVSLPQLHDWTLADRCTSVELRLALASLLVPSRAGSR